MRANKAVYNNNCKHTFRIFDGRKFGAKIPVQAINTAEAADNTAKAEQGFS